MRRGLRRDRGRRELGRRGGHRRRHKGWVGIEALSGIPGTTGATPIQNVGAYGQEVSQTVARVRTWDRKLRGIRTFAADECSFGYRTSRFKQDPGRFVVLSTTFQFPLGDLGAPGAVRRAGRRPRHRRRRACPGARRARGRARPASTQGDGARPGGPRHLEHGVVLHQPDRRGGRRTRRCADLAAVGGAGQDERCLADRAGRLHQGLRQRPGPALLTAHARPDQPR